MWKTNACNRLADVLLGNKRCSQNLQLWMWHQDKAIRNPNITGTETRFHWSQVWSLASIQYCAQLSSSYLRQLSAWRYTNVINTIFSVLADVGPIPGAAPVSGAWSPASQLLLIVLNDPDMECINDVVSFHHLIEIPVITWSLATYQHWHCGNVL